MKQRNFAGARAPGKTAPASSVGEFSGFSKETFRFFTDLYDHNSVTWFRKHRDEYEQYLMNPARAFVTSIGPFIKFINPTFDTEPKFNRTLVRLNRDMRFAKKPYKDFFLIRFGKTKWGSELFLFLDRNGIELGSFVNNEKNNGHHLFEENIANHGDAFVEACRRYKINGEFSAYELHSGTVPISEKFSVGRDRGKFKGIEYIIFGKELGKKDPVVCSPRLLALAMKIYNRLYPLYIFSTSHNPVVDLESYDDRIGLLKISSK